MKSVEQHGLGLFDRWTTSKRCYQIGRCCRLICYHQTVHTKGFKWITHGGNFGRPAEAGRGGGRSWAKLGGGGGGGPLGALLASGAEIGTIVLVWLRFFAVFRHFEAQGGRPFWILPNMWVLRKFYFSICYYEQNGYTVIHHAQNVC